MNVRRAANIKRRILCHKKRRNSPNDKNWKEFGRASVKVAVNFTIVTASLIFFFFARKFGIKRVDKDQILTVKEIRSPCFAVLEGLRQSE